MTVASATISSDPKIALRTPPIDPKKLPVGSWVKKLPLIELSPSFNR